MKVIFRFSAERTQPQETSETKRESTTELSRFKGNQMTLTRCDFCKETNEIMFNFQPTEMTRQSERWKVSDVKAWGSLMSTDVCPKCAKYMFDHIPIVK